MSNEQSRKNFWKNNLKRFVVKHALGKEERI